MQDHSLPELLVACLCADWCGTCRDYRSGFDALANLHPNASFQWIDVEDDADWIGDYDVENFPTLLIQHNNTVLFFGTMLPQVKHLQRTLETLTAMPPDEMARYATATDERRNWQRDCNLRAAIIEHRRQAQS